LRIAANSANNGNSSPSIEVGMMFVWIIVGIAVVATAFFFPSSQASLWPQVNAAGIAAAAYLTVLVAYCIRKPFPVKTRLIVWLVFLVTGAGVVTAWRTMDEMSHFQRSTLLQIHRSISDGALIVQSEQPFLETLKAYYKQGKGKKETLGALFRRSHPDAKIGTNIHIPEFEGDSTRIYLAELSDTEVVLIGRVTYVKGRVPDFQNYDGRKGMLQERTTLTEKGVRYESEN